MKIILFVLVLFSSSSFAAFNIPHPYPIYTYFLLDSTNSDYGQFYRAPAGSKYPVYPSRHPEYPNADFLVGYEYVLSGSRYVLDFYSNTLEPRSVQIASLYLSAYSFHVLGWFTRTYIYREVAGIQYRFYYYYTIDASPFDSQLCPDGTKPVGISAYFVDVIPPSGYHSICVSDYYGSGNYKYMPISDYCGGTESGRTTEGYYLLACKTALFPPSQVYLADSEETQKTKNKLLSESNSKLGIIVNVNVKITNLLKQIKDTLLSLSSKNFGVFGTNANSPDPSNKDNPNSPEYEPKLSDSDIDVSHITPLISSKSVSCPADISISVLNSTHNFSYQPFCDFAENLNPLVIAAARVAAAWLVIGAL